MSAPIIHQMSVVMSQDNNTDGTTGDNGEHMTIDLEALWMDDGGGYAVVQTEGWSVDDAEEMARLIGAVQGAAIGLKKALADLYGYDGTDGMRP